MGKIIITFFVVLWIFIFHNKLNEIQDKQEEITIKTEEYNAMRERLIISEALVRKCTENDSIDIMQYVRDVKAEIKIEQQNDKAMEVDNE